MILLTCRFKGVVGEARFSASLSHKQTVFSTKVLWNRSIVLSTLAADCMGRLLKYCLLIESIKTTSMENVRTGVLEKIKNTIYEVKIKPKNDMMYQDICNCICQNHRLVKPVLARKQNGCRQVRSVCKKEIGNLVYFHRKLMALFSCCFFRSEVHRRWQCDYYAAD